MNAKTILVLAANPTDTATLRLDEEVREIGNGLERAKHRDRFVIRPVLAARPVDVRRAMLDLKPAIVHFSGHGTGAEGIAFEDDEGRSKLVDAPVLADFFKLFAPWVECVVLNACYSQEQALAIAEHVPHVVGMSEAIGDAAAIEFAVAFYDAIGAGYEVPFAHDLACNAMAWAGLVGSRTPVLIEQSGRGEGGPGPVTHGHAPDTRARSASKLHSLDSLVSEGASVAKIKAFVRDNESILESVPQFSGGRSAIENLVDFPVTDGIVPDFTRLAFTDPWSQAFSRIHLIRFVEPRAAIFADGLSFSETVSDAEDALLAGIDHIKSNYNEYCRRLVAVDGFGIPLASLENLASVRIDGVIVASRRKLLTRAQVEYLSGRNGDRSNPVSIVTYDFLIEFSG